MDILARIEDYAKTQGDKVAFSSRDGEITYLELWEKSARMAETIECRMQDNREPVVVYGHKDPMMIVCFLACVRSGRAYCPVDVSVPNERVEQIVGTIGDPLVLIATERCSLDANLCEQMLSYEELKEITSSARECSVSSDAGKVELGKCTGEDVHYIIFTSGTTGRPKGVQITTENLNNYLEWAVTLDGGIEEGANFLNQAPYSFDLSVMDLYLSLATGGRVVAADKELQQNNSELLEYTSGQRINYWVSTPSFADLCLADADFNGEKLAELKAWLFCGEVLTNQTAQELLERFPKANLINTYGPTESTVCVTEVRISKSMAESGSPLPVGKVKPGSSVALDPDTSEIIIIGDTVSPGYYKLPEQTAKAFYQREGIRAYRTGDKGHFDENGLLYCDGRIDNQIKLHGYRIELEDIEANLMKIDGVQRAAVVPRFKDGKAESLTAFVIRDRELISDDYEGRKCIRLALRTSMPSYMVPKRIVMVEELPMTNNGKLDRKRLKEMA